MYAAPELRAACISDTWYAPDKKMKHLEWLLCFVGTNEDPHRLDRDLSTVEQFTSIHITKTSVRYGKVTTRMEI